MLLAIELNKPNQIQPNQIMCKGNNFPIFLEKWPCISFQGGLFIWTPHERVFSIKRRVNWTRIWFMFIPTPTRGICKHFNFECYPFTPSEVLLLRLGRPWVQKYLFIRFCMTLGYSINEPFSFSNKESESTDIFIHFEEFLNVHNSGSSSNTNRPNLPYKNVSK